MPEPPQYLDKNFKPISPATPIGPPKYLDRNLQPIEPKTAKQPKGFDIGDAVMSFPGFKVAKALAIDPVVEGVENIKKGNISPATTVLGGLAGTAIGGPIGGGVGAGLGSLVGQTAEQLVKGNTPNPFGIIGNATVDGTINYAIDKATAGAGSLIGKRFALKAEGSESPIKEMLLKKFFPAKTHPENLDAARSYADKIPLSVGQATGNPLALNLEQGWTGGKTAQLSEAQRIGIDREFAKYDKKFYGDRKPSQSTFGQEAQRIIYKSEEVPLDELGDPSKFFEKAFSNIDEAKRIKRSLTLRNPEGGKVAAGAYYEYLMEKATDKYKRTYDPRVVINALKDNDSPGKVLLHHKQSEALVNFNRQLQNINASKAALGLHDEDIVLGLTASMLTAGKQISWSRSRGILEGAKVVLTVPIARALMDPKNAKLATRLTKVKADSPEAKFASRALMLAMKGQQVKLQIPNAGIFNASINEQGKIEVEGAQ